MRVERIGDATLYTGDVLECLREMADDSVHCVVTSPPYWGLRDYGIEPRVWDGEPECEHEWGATVPGNPRGGSGTPTDKNNRGENYGRDATRGAFCGRCGGWRGCLGLEPTPELYVQHIVQVFREARRVLRADGTVWLNVGDCYHSGDRGGYRNDSHRWENCPIQSQAKGSHLEAVSPNRLRQVGLKDKDLVGIPWRVAFALQADGWYLRSDIIWNKPNPMPESVTDRPTKSHEYLFLLSKSARYFYDAEAIKERCESGPSDVRKMIESLPRIGGKYKELVDPLSKASATTNIGQKRAVGGIRIHGNLPGRDDGGAACNDPGQLYRNRRTVWTIATQPYKDAHFATFPEKLVEPCILAGCPAQVCPECGAPWVRVVERGTLVSTDGTRDDYRPTKASDDSKIKGRSEGWTPNHMRPATILGFRPTCACGTEDPIPQGEIDADPTLLDDFEIEPLSPIPGTMLDLFCGSGTALLVALRLGRRAGGIELKPEYMDLTCKRIAPEAAQVKLEV